MGFKNLFRKEPNEVERQVAALVEVMVGMADLTEEKVTALQGEVPSELESRLDGVRNSADEFFAAYENREWGNLGFHNGMVNYHVGQVDQYLKESGLAAQLQAFDDGSTSE